MANLPKNTTSKETPWNSPKLAFYSYVYSPIRSSKSFNRNWSPLPSISVRKAVVNVVLSFDTNWNHQCRSKILGTMCHRFLVGKAVVRSSSLLPKVCIIHRRNTDLRIPGRIIRRVRFVRKSEVEIRLEIQSSHSASNGITLDIGHSCNKV